MASIKIKQHDIKDCGAACLASVGNYYGVNIPIAKIRQYAHTDRKGTNIMGLLQGAEQMGLSAKGVKGEIEALRNIPLPAIAHVVIGSQLKHFVVIYKITKKEVKVMDPGKGSFHTYSLEEFKKIWTGVLVLLAKSEEFKERNEKTSGFVRFWQLVKPHKSILLQALLGAIIFTILGLATSIYVQKITDYVLVGGNRKLLNLLSVIMLIIIIFRAYIGSLKSILVIKSGQLIDASLILGYYKHLLELPQRFFDTMQIGEIISRVNDAVKIRAFINNVAIDFLVNIFIVIFSFTLMFTYYWKLALVILLVIPLYLLLYYIINKLNKKVERTIMEDSADLQTQLVESLTHIRTVKEFGIEDYSNSKTENKFIKLLFTGYKSATNSIFTGTSTSFLASLFTVILLWLGANYVLDGEITTGELFSFYALIGYFNSPISSLITMNKTIQNALIAADRLFEIMDLEIEETKNKLSLQKDDIGDIRFENVSFRYGTRAWVLENLDLCFEKNKTTAIVGESGSGKTTLISLIQNLYNINEGKIFFGAYDSSHLNKKSLQKQIGVIPQQLNLFSGTVIENIALGESFPDIQRILNISKDLGITDFVEKLPYGFETQLGENGASLSGGQRQRIAIARALYKNPEILLLDEATSALDSKSEMVVKESLEKFKNQGKTIIVIAHRLSTIANSDRIIVMEAGKVIESGKHHDLLLKNGKYFELWSNQNLV